MRTAVTAEEIRHGLRTLGLARRPLCVHSSLRSFGWVEGGADAVVDALLVEGCTVLVPSYSWSYLVAPPVDMRPARNGWDYERSPETLGEGRIYRTHRNEIDRAMGAIPRAVINRSESLRGDHPLCSFAAVGPHAVEFVGGQGVLDVHAPLRALLARRGFAVLMGVALTSLTLLHLAEEEAGRRLFRRWANDPEGVPVEVECGGCSLGFAAFEPLLEPVVRETSVGESSWRAFPARQVVDIASHAIRRQPRITHCGRADCGRCDDAVAGGPLLEYSRGR